MNRLIIYCCALICLSCGASIDEKKSIEDLTVESKESLKEEEIEKSDSDCHFTNNLSSYLDEIINNPTKFVNNRTDDECVILLIDNLSQRSISQKDSRYFKALTAICSVSDGYVSEHLMTISVFQFYNNLDNFMTIVNNDTCLRKEVIWGLSMDVSVGGERQKNRIIQHASESIVSDSNRIILKKILSEIDPTYFD